MVDDPNVLLGLGRPDDAGIYRINDEVALVQTLDFFTPIVDDPYTFGRIAATNSLSDVYAMGGVPKTAMNIVCFPDKELPISVLHTILQGGLSVLNEAGCALLGGHSVRDPELKYGLSVTGIVHPKHYLANSGKAGDVLVLTKPIGTGVVGTAIKRQKASPEAEAEAIEAMTTLNRWPDGGRFERLAHGATDVTGFGLIGHAREMIDETDVGLVLRAGSIPLLHDAMVLAEGGHVPGGTKRNIDFYSHCVDYADGISQRMIDLLHDPQTAGGLLITIAPEHAEELVAAMRAMGRTHVAIIGELVPDPSNRIRVDA